MAIAKRIFLFIAVNLLVITTISIILSVLGITGGVTSTGIDYGMLFSFCLVWGMGGAFISLALSRIMAKWMMGVKPIDPQTRDPQEQWLLETVKNLINRAGLSTMPEVGIYDSPEVNAFATGPTKNRALVAVSSGLFARMNKDQIEGVLAHEVTHIANGDMVTMTLLQGIVNAFVMFFARIIAWGISQNVREEARGMVYMISTFVLQILLTFLGYIVVAYFSRWREFRADAGGARFAGREKMTGALRALQGTMTMVDNSQQALNSFKISGGPSKFLQLMSTHPPLDERIRRLESVRDSSRF